MALRTRTSFTAGSWVLTMRKSSSLSPLVLDDLDLPVLGLLAELHDLGKSEVCIIVDVTRAAGRCVRVSPVGDRPELDRVEVGQLALP